jgi:hypothetical protein
VIPARFEKFTLDNWLLISLPNTLLVRLHTASIKAHKWTRSWVYFIHFSPSWTSAIEWILNTILPYPSLTSNWQLSKSFSHQNCAWIHYLLHRTPLNVTFEINPSFLAYFHCFEKTEVSLWGLTALWVSVCVSPRTISERLNWSLRNLVCMSFHMITSQRHAS